MKIIKLASLFALIASISACTFHVGGSSKTANISLSENLSLDANALTKLNIEAGAGSLVVRSSDSQQILVEARIKTDENRSYTLTLKNSGDTGILIAKQHNSGFWHGSSPYIDLVVSIPHGLNLDIEDGSGSINISNLKSNITIDDGSGGIDMKKIVGTVSINDGSGHISLTNIQGNVSVEDGSGSLDIENTAGNINIEDGSGGISVLDTTGHVTIDDGSGGIRVNNAGGLKIIEAGSGNLSVSDINGNIKIES